MIIDILKRLLQLLVLLLLQVMLFNHIIIMGYATPLVYVALLLCVPLNANHVTTLISAFLMGLLVDMFSTTPGVSACSFTLVAMMQPWLLKLHLPKDALEDMVPSYKTMGAWNHLRYMTLLLLPHHIVYFLLESFSFFNITSLSLACLISFAASWIIIAVMELLRK